MRALRLALAGAMALAVSIAAQAGPLGVARADRDAASGVVQIQDRGGPDWRRAPNHGTGSPRQWKDGWQRGPNGGVVGWGSHPGTGVPTYWVWGPSGGAFDYPFADWRGPTGGWGNP
jgi:hypothetical protein